LSNRFGILSYWVCPVIWPSFTEIGEMSCITSAWSSGKHALNIKKSKFIIFKSHKKRFKRQLHFQLSGSDLQRVEESKFLGIIIDQHLTWKNHIEYVIKKIITTGLLCRIHFYIDQSRLVMLYNSLIYPHLHYGNIVWANNYPTRLDRLFKLQKKILQCKNNNFLIILCTIFSAFYTFRSSKYLSNKWFSYWFFQFQPQ